MIKAVLFDLDNTLIDYAKMKRHSIEAAIDGMIDAGLKIKKQQAIKVIYELFDKHGMEYHTIFQTFLKKTIGKVDYRILANGVVAYRKVKFGFLEPYPHTSYVLLKLRSMGIKLGIVTDAPRLKAWLRLAAIKLSDFFDVVVTYEDTNKLKPHNLPFNKCLRLLKLKPEQCLMVGDRPERDIRGAEKIGIKTCFARYGNSKSKRVQADFVIKDIKDLLEIVKI